VGRERSDDGCIEPFYGERERIMAHRVCPVWLGYFLASPLRRLLQDPEKILSPHIRPGIRALDVGCAMGFFTLPMARMAGENGKVYGVDMQPGMLRELEKRAAKADLGGRIETRMCRADSLCLEDVRGTVDFAIAIAMVHEVPDPARLFRELYDVLKPGGRLLLAEPKGHVSAEAFETTVSLARETGFSEAEQPEIPRGRAVILKKGNVCPV
jgi:ubiquinone/menaquinone biosynthesis C-methylase UbiE